MYNGNLNPQRGTVGMKISFAMGVWNQFVTFFIYIILYQHISKHDNSMLQVAIITDDTYRVIIHSFHNFKSCEVVAAWQKMAIHPPPPPSRLVSFTP